MWTRCSPTARSSWCLTASPTSSSGKHRRRSRRSWRGPSARTAIPGWNGTPYADLSQKWVPDTTDLPSAVDDLLAAREVALRKKVAEDAARLRDEVQDFGFALRDDGTH